MLVDLELAGLGPATYDLAPQLVAVRRYGAAPAGFEEFSSAYGFDLRDWDGATLMCSVQELWVTAWAVGNRHHSETVDREAEVRLEVWRGATDPPRWQLR